MVYNIVVILHPSAKAIPLRRAGRILQRAGGRVWEAPASKVEKPQSGVSHVDVYAVILHPYRVGAQLYVLEVVLQLPRPDVVVPKV